MIIQVHIFDIYKFVSRNQFEFVSVEMGIVLIKWFKFTLTKWVKNLLNGTITLGKIFFWNNYLIFLQFYFHFEWKFVKIRFVEPFFGIMPILQINFHRSWLDQSWLQSADCRLRKCTYRCNTLYICSCWRSAYFIHWWEILYFYLLKIIIFRRTNGWQHTNVCSLLLRGFAQWGWQFW